MKKVLFLLTTLLVVVTLCGCNNEKNKENITYKCYKEFVL